MSTVNSCYILDMINITIQLLFRMAIIENTYASSEFKCILSCAETKVVGLSNTGLAQDGSRISQNIHATHVYFLKK